MLKFSPKQQELFIDLFFTSPVEPQNRKESEEFTNSDVLRLIDENVDEENRVYRNIENFNLNLQVFNTSGTITNDLSEIGIDPNSRILGSCFLDIQVYAFNKIGSQIPIGSLYFKLRRNNVILDSPNYNIRLTKQKANLFIKKKFLGLVSQDNIVYLALRFYNAFDGVNRFFYSPVSILQSATLIGNIYSFVLNDIDFTEINNPNRKQNEENNQDQNAKQGLVRSDKIIKTTDGKLITEEAIITGECLLDT